MAQDPIRPSSSPFAIVVALAWTALAAGGCSNIIVNDGGAFAPGKLDEFDYYIGTSKGPVKVSTGDYNRCASGYLNQPDDTDDLVAGRGCAKIAGALDKFDRSLALRFARKGCEQYRQYSACTEYIRIHYDAGNGSPADIAEARRYATNLCRSGRIYHFPRERDRGEDKRLDLCSYAASLYPPRDPNSVALHREACNNGLQYSCENLRQIGVTFDERAARAAEQERAWQHEVAMAEQRARLAEERQERAEAERQRKQSIENLANALASASRGTVPPAGYVAAPSMPGSHSLQPGTSIPPSYNAPRDSVSSGQSGQPAAGVAVTQKPRSVDCVTSTAAFRAPPNETELKITFVNRCGATVQVVWCTELRSGRWTKEWTRLSAGRTETIPEFNAAGRYKWWACEDSSYECTAKCPGS